jgi:hypothetical protein
MLDYGAIISYTIIVVILYLIWYLLDKKLKEVHNAKDKHTPKVRANKSR